jgi:hypothetical protein
VKKGTPQYRDGTLGWWLMEAGWTPIEQTQCARGGKHAKDASGKCEKCLLFPHPLWQYADFDNPVTGWQARRLELLRIHNDFKFKARGAKA